MWLLENDGDVFHGKRLWLRPGKRFIFGRTSAEAGGFVIENKTISRKHLIVQVDDVEPSDCYKPKTRSKITLEDLNTKIGTLVNGTQIRGQRHLLNKAENEIKLGQYDKLFRIFWSPVVLSFSFTGKELKAAPLQSISKKLEALDIKVSLDYLRDKTTHVVSAKRNTSKGLQALINGKYIVNHSFIDAVLAATKTEYDGISALESNFDSHWPNELQHLPPTGMESTQRSSDAYAPDLKRRDIFDGYTFIFYDKAQFNNLLAPITDGRGKALLRQVEPLKTDIENFIRYVKGVAGEKGLGGFEDGSEGKGVVVVRHQPLKGPTLEWYAEFGRQVALHLDHRLIEQNEFLDAILNNDASVLRKPLELEESSALAPTPTAGSVTTLKSLPALMPSSSAYGQALTTDEAVTLGPSAPAPLGRKIGRSRRTITSQFKGFDNDFETPVESATPKRHEGLPSHDLGLFVSQIESQGFNQQSSEVVTVRTNTIRKRASPLPLLEEKEEDIWEQLAPAATDLKRRRQVDEQSSDRSKEVKAASPLPDAKHEAAQIKIKTKKERPEVDFLEVARQRREKEEAIARAEDEALQEAMDGVDVEQLRNLVIVEEIEVKRTAPIQRTVSRADESDRWDERWNGRKNFKRFRRKGEADLRVMNKVIVPLEEVKKKDFGIGNEYWLEGERDTSRRKKGKGRAKSLQPGDNIESQLPASQIYVDKAIAVKDAQMMESSPLSQRTITRSQNLYNKMNTLQSQPSSNKRAGETLSKQTPTKKARQSTRQDSDDSEDGLGFRFKKK